MNNSTSSSHNVSITTDSLLYFAKQQEKNEILIEQYRKIVFAYVEKYPANYRSLPTELKEDKEILMHALSAITNYEIPIKDFIPEKYCDNEQIMLLAILRNSRFFEQLSDRLKSDTNFMLAVPTFHRETIKYVPTHLLDDEYFVTNQVNALCFVFGSVSERLRDNKELMLCAVKQYGENLRHASLRLQGDEQVVYAAVKQTPRAWSYADKEKIQDKYDTVQMFMAKYSFPSEK